MPITRFLTTPLFLTLIACLSILGGATPLAAQNLFAPVITVNDRVITRYEIDQRSLFLKLLRAPGDLQKEAEKRLIEERVQLDAAKAMGISVTEEQIIDGMEEFAGRANLTSAEFIKAIAPAGIAPETFREFVRAGLSWREVVRARFSARARVSASDIDRALSQTATRGSVRVLLSEIILPATPREAAASEARARSISQITSTSAFSAAARQYSVTSTRDRGGKLDWMPLSNLPEQISAQILALTPGQVTGPIPVPNAIALFQLRAIEEVAAPPVAGVSVDYAAYYIAGGRSATALAEAKRVKNKVDTCDDLYGIAKGKPKEVLDRGKLPLSQVPKDIALELAKLDAGEVSTELTRSNGQTLVFLMLCERSTELAEGTSRDDIGQQLTNQRLTSYANGYLSELLADAIIRRP